MVNLSAEEAGEQVPVNQPHVPAQFMNGHHDWYIVIDHNGQEVIELVDSDNDDGPPPAPNADIHMNNNVEEPPPVPSPDPHMNAAASPPTPNPGPHMDDHVSDNDASDNFSVEEDGILDAVEIVDRAVQVYPWELENPSALPDRYNKRESSEADEKGRDDSESSEGNVEPMDVDPPDSQAQGMVSLAYEPVRPGYCRGCGHPIVQRSFRTSGRRSRRFCGENNNVYIKYI